jgi:hypothetical protein
MRQEKKEIHWGEERKTHGRDEEKHKNKETNIDRKKGRYTGGTNTCRKEQEI